MLRNCYYGYQFRLFIMINFNIVVDDDIAFVVAVVLKTYGIDFAWYVIALSIGSICKNVFLGIFFKLTFYALTKQETRNLTGPSLRKRMSKHASIELERRVFSLSHSDLLFLNVTNRNRFVCFLLTYYRITIF